MSVSERETDRFCEYILYRHSVDCSSGIMGVDGDQLVNYMLHWLPIYKVAALTHNQKEEGCNNPICVCVCVPEILCSPHIQPLVCMRVCVNKLSVACTHSCTHTHAYNDKLASLYCTLSNTELEDNQTFSSCTAILGLEIGSLHFPLLFIYTLI